VKGSRLNVRPLLRGLLLLVLALVGLYALLLLFTAATPAVFVGGVAVLVAVLGAIVFLRRGRPSTD
jgi:hypothetical protein